MKRHSIFGIMLALMCCLFLSACTTASSEEEGDDGDMVLKYSEAENPTEKQKQIARDLGRTDKQVAAMDDGWDNYSEWAHVAYAELIINHMESRYGESFKAVSIAIPELMDRRFRMTLEVTTGPYEGSTCTCYYTWKDQEVPYFSDGYFTILRRDEYENDIKDLVREVYGGTAASVGVMKVDILGTRFPDSIDPDISVDELALETTGRIDIFFPPDCELTEEEYYRMLDELLELFKEKTLGMGYRVAFITELYEAPEYSEFCVAQAIASMEKSTEEHPTYKWKEGGGVSGKNAGDE